jgi:type I restriction enzyme S subunit
MMNQENSFPELPRGWVWTRLGEVLSLVKGKKPKNLGIQGDNLIVPYVNIEVFEHKVVNQFTDGMGCVLCKPSDVLIVWDGARCGLVGKGASGAVGSTLAKVNCYELNKLYVFYFLRSQFQHINEQPRGVGIPHVEPNLFWNIPIPLPPLAEQHRIVAKIEELFTKLDAGVSLLEKVKAQLKRYRQAVLKYAFEGKLTEEWREAHKGEMEPASSLLERIKEERQKNAKDKFRELPPVDTSDLPELPEEWVWTRVGEIGDVITGTTPSKSKKEYYDNSFPFFKPTDLNDGYYVRKSEDGLSKKGIEKARILPAKSILVTCIGATIGKTGFIRTEGASNQQINAIIPQKRIFPEFIYFISISPQFQKSIVDNASATTLPILNKSKFEILSIPLPPLSEQQKIVEEIERRLSVADEVEKIVVQSLKQAERLRQSILKKAFEGKLVPQDPTDEPASVLLERIKEEKTKHESIDKKRGNGKKSGGITLNDFGRV